MDKLHHDEYYLLSKSTFMMGWQCSKRLWLHKRRPDLIPGITGNKLALFERGNDIGLLARALFPGGKEATPANPTLYDESIRKTYEWINYGESIIYDAAFQYNEVMAAIDILVKRQDKWYAYEVKASTTVKDHHLADAALQYYVITNAGLQLEDISLIYINKKYVRKDILDPNSLFKIVSVKEEILKLQESVIEKIKEFKEILQDPLEPIKDIGTHCSEPHVCEFRDYCWNHIPPVSVFDLSKLKANKKFKLYTEGIIEFHQLPEGFSLTYAQELQVRAHLEDSIHIEPEKIIDWLKLLNYPIYYMDFETFNPAIPLYDKSKPYQHIPFQFSVHLQDEPEVELKHFEFLGSPESDPRPEFAKQLISVTKGSGTILVYSSFEMSRLKDLISDYPEFGPGIDALNNRIIDLMTPFENKWYYHPSLNGSYSIKKVLPSLVPEFSYSNLEINDGATAMAAFESLLRITNIEVKQTIREALLKYCKMDTWAMVRILDKLQAIN